MATFTNQIKNAISPSQIKKIVGGGYSFARYGMSKYGTTGLQFTNLVKSTLLGMTWNSMIDTWTNTTLTWAEYSGSMYRNKIKN